MANSVSFTWKLVDRFRTPASRIGRQVQGLQRGITRLGVTSDRVGRKMTKMGQSVQTASIASTVAIAGSVKAFADMEKGVTNVLTLLDDPTEIEKFRGEFTKLSEGAVRMGFSMNDSNKALFDSVSALGAGKKAAESFNAAQVLAVGGVTDLAVATDGITSLVNAYAEDNISGMDAANALFAAQQKGKTTVALLSSNIGKVAPIAKSAGIGMNDLLAATAQLTLGGLSTEEATTGLKGAIKGLISPSKEAEAVLKAMGVPFNATMVQSVGLAESLRLLAVAAEKWPNSLTDAIPDVRAYTAIASLNGEALKNLTKIQNSVNNAVDSGTVVTKAASAQMETLSFQLGQTGGELKIMAAGIGEALAPAVKVLGVVIRGLTTAFSGVSKPVKTFLATLLVVVAVAAPILLFFGKLGIVVGAITAAIGGAFAATGVAVVAVVAAIIAAVGLLIFKFDTVKEKFNSGVGVVKKFFGFGDEELNVKGSGEVNQNARLDVNVGIAGPKGAIESVKSKTSGRITGLNQGVALEESL